jgi:Zn-dependent protease with chaperone function
MPAMTLRRHTAIAVAVLFLVTSSSSVWTQTRIVPPKNKYSPADDVKIGREAAAEVRKQYPVITDGEIAGYMGELGRRLVAAAPLELNRPEFEYSFTPVNLKEINAFALPGGPMFINRGMVDAAQSEGEVVGVMAHELSHVLLRHGTANATKAQGFQLGALAGAIAGAVVGGGVGQVISQGSQFGLGTWLMKYGRDYEKQADLLGAQIMARAGYDPRDLARMFETIEKQSKGSGGPEWLSSHPNPGNRTKYIAQEAAQLQIGPRPNDRGFANVKARFASLPPARSMAEVGKGGGGGSGEDTTAVGTIGREVPRPSTQYKTARGGNLFQVNVPSNWTAVSSNSSVKYVPQNGYGPYQGQTVLTHGVELGVARASSRDLRAATDELIQSFLRGNPDMRQAGQQSSVRLSNRNATLTPLAGRSAVGGNELVDLYTTLLADGNLFYYATVVPDSEARYFTEAFDRIGQSIRLTDR